MRIGIGEEMIGEIIAMMSRSIGSAIEGGMIVGGRRGNVAESCS